LVGRTKSTLPSIKAVRTRSNVTSEIIVEALMGQGLATKRSPSCRKLTAPLLHRAHRLPPTKSLMLLRATMEEEALRSKVLTMEGIIGMHTLTRAYQAASS
jgi:hypothetical protein